MDEYQADVERTCWVVTDGRAGIEAQALGLAEAIARRGQWRIVRLRAPRARPFATIWATPSFRDLIPVDASDPERFWAAMALHDTSPWPDLWIGCGRASLPYSEAVRDWSQRETFVVQLQDPLRPPELFDLVIPPQHDELGPSANVLPIIGSPNRVTPERVSAAALATPGLPDAPRPRVAALIGGDSKRHRFTRRIEQAVSDALEELSEQGAYLMITTSRRTPATLAGALKERFGARRTVRVWTGEEDGPNPYLAFLGAADVVLATKDSVNMIGEAASAAKPVLLVEVDGRDGKFARFYGALAARGNVRPFTGRLETWPVEALTETDRAAGEVLTRLAERQRLVGRAPA